MTPYYPGLLTRTVACAAAATLAGSASILSAPPVLAAPTHTTTPITHVVVVYGENISFDHYFGTYPKAANIPGETLQGSGLPAPAFHAAPGTPTPNNLISANAIDNNPNLRKPFRFTPSQAVTCDQNHEYRGEQEAFNRGKMDQFVQTENKEKCNPTPGMYDTPGAVMGYYDGNTAQTMWNLAQNYTLSDNHWGSVFGPSTPGALNLIAGQTAGASTYTPDGKPANTPNDAVVIAPNAQGIGTVVEDPDPAFDDCSNKNGKSSSDLAGLQGRNVGNLLNEKHVTWGWFQGGFRPTEAAHDGKRAICGAQHTNVAGQPNLDYSPHHSPFQYFPSTSNPHHLPPTAVSMIGKTDQANHLYDLTDFYAALKAGDMPSVSFIKAPEYQDGHAAYSDPIDEGQFAAKITNLVQQSPDWKSTAIIYAYDDSDGWYDHAAPHILNGSNDRNNDAAICKDADATTPALGGINGRCGPGTRHPMLVISPYAKKNVINHAPTEQASILRFIEDNWSLGRIGGGSFDQRAGSMESMFDFAAAPRTDHVWLDEKTGALTTRSNVTTPAAAASGYELNSQGENHSHSATQASTDHDSGQRQMGLLYAVVGGVIIAVALGMAGWFSRQRKKG